MNRKDCLVMGCGGCGCNQLDELLNIDSRYASFFINTNLGELEGLKKCNERNSFYVPNADGTSKKRDLAKKYFIEEQANLIDILSKFIQPYVFLLASADGGTGSTATIILSKILHRLAPEKKINVITTFPSLKAGEDSFKNTLEFWNELIGLYSKHIINSMQFIDNNKPFSEEEINTRAMKIFDNSFDLVNGKIDSADLESCHNNYGYKAILDIKNDSVSLLDGLMDSIEDSVYYLPKINENGSVIYQCKKLVANINKNYNVKELTSIIEIFDDYKINTSYDKDTIIVMSGCKIPKEPIELIKGALDDIKSRNKDFDNDEDDLLVDIEKDKPKEQQPVKKKKSSRMTKEELDAFLSDDLF